MKKIYFVFFSSLITYSSFTSPMFGQCCEGYPYPCSPSEYTQQRDCNEDDLPYSSYYPYGYRYYYPDLDEDTCD